MQDSRTPRLVEHFWVPILGASCSNKLFVGTVRPSHFKAIAAQLLAGEGIQMEVRQQTVARVAAHPNSMPLSWWISRLRVGCKEGSPRGVV